VRSTTPNRLDTRFSLASITKSITAAAVFRLRDQERLALDDPLEQFVLEYPDTIAMAVTVRDLLTHQSGIELDNSDGFNEAKPCASSLDEVLELHLTYLDTLRREEPNRTFPLDKFDCTNEGYDLLGLIIERVSDHSYPDAVQELVLRPAGTHDTGFILPTHPVPDLATPQYSSLSRDTPPRVGTPRTETFWRYPEPAGGMYVKAGDLSRFVQSLVDGRLLDGETAETGTQTQVSRFRPPPVMSAGYRFGFETGAVGGRAFSGHGGTYGGVSTNVAHFPDTGHTIVVLSIYSFVGHGVFSYVRDLVTPAS
jgi:CubicO group peptidase (beta-lactamase class C family)